MTVNKNGLFAWNAYTAVPVGGSPGLGASVTVPVTGGAGADYFVVGVSQDSGSSLNLQKTGANFSAVCYAQAAAVAQPSPTPAPSAAPSGSAAPALSCTDAQPCTVMVAGMESGAAAWYSSIAGSVDELRIFVMAAAAIGLFLLSMTAFVVAWGLRRG